MKGRFVMKKSLNKAIAVFLVFALLLSTALSTSSATEAEINAIVLYTNDVHCSIDDYAVFAAYRAQLINEGYNVITVDGGDAIQGEIIGTMTQGSAIADIMNTVGYDYAVPGNHEFDYGTDTLLALAENDTDYSYTSCNFTDLRTGNTVFEPYYIEEVNGEKLAFVGITTPEAYTKSTPAYFQDGNGNYIYGFSEDTFYSTIQSAVDSAIADGANRVIAVGHLGVDGVTEGWKSVDVIKNTRDIDVFIDAHSHEKIESETHKNAEGEDVLLSSTSSKFSFFGQLTLRADSSEESKLINPDSIDVEALSDSAQTAYNQTKIKVDAYNAEMSYLFEKLGTSEVNMTVYDETGNWLVRRVETNMGDFVADAYRELTGADVAFANGGGIRAEIKAGEVTRKSLMDINPWNNSMCVIKVTGQQILDALEHGARLYPENSGGFLQVSGLTYEINAWTESPVIVDGMGNFVKTDETKTHRIANVKIGGSDLDLAATYTLAGNAYALTQGGDGFTMFTGVEIVKADGLPTDAEMLIKYFTENLGGKITAEKYGNEAGSGRITVNETEPIECDCICHIDCFFVKALCRILRFFFEVFGVHQLCNCGVAHW